MKIDSTDLKILGILQERGRITNAQLSTEIGLSPAPTLERVRKLESSGFIQSFHAMVDAEKLGWDVIIFLEVSLNYNSVNEMEKFIEEINKIHEIMEAYQITGDGDFLLKIYVKSIRDYERFLRESLLEVKGIGNMKSKVVLNTVKKSMILPVNGSYVNGES